MSYLQKKKKNSLVSICWINLSVEKIIWEIEDEFRDRRCKILKNIFQNLKI